MIFAVPSHTQSASLDSWEAESNSLAQGGSINVWDPILVTNTAVREVEPLTRNIAIRVGGIVCSQPVSGTRNKWVNIQSD